MRAQRERRLAIVWGVSALTWATLAALEGVSGAVGLASIALHALVGVLFLRRRVATREGTLLQHVLSLPALLVGGWVLSLATPASSWNGIAMGVFGVGAVLTLVSLTYLGRSFAVLPAVREVVQSGPYRFVRHPACLGQLLMLGAVCASLPTGPGLGLAVLVVASMVVRLLAEEDALRTVSAYRAYCRDVRARLVPGVW